MSRYPSQVAYYKCDKDMIRTFITHLCEYAKFMYTNILN